MNKDELCRLSTICPMAPTEDRVVLIRKPKEEKTHGGIIIPDAIKEVPEQGYVLKVGPGKKVEGVPSSVDIPPLACVVFNKYAGTTVELDGQEYVIIREMDVLAVVE